jgi:hypothetical protein
MMSLILPLITALVGTIGLAFIFRPLGAKGPASAKIIAPAVTVPRVDELERQIAALESKFDEARPEWRLAEAR